HRVHAARDRRGVYTVVDRSGWKDLHAERRPPVRDRVLKADVVSGFRRTGSRSALKTDTTDFVDHGTPEGGRYSCSAPASCRRNNPTSVTIPIVCDEPRSASLVTTAGLMS